jgi:hypothetical protein
MAQWVDGTWIPSPLPGLVIDRIKSGPKIKYGRNRVYAAVRLLTWLANHQVIASRGCVQALVEPDPKWASYAPAVLGHYCGTYPVSHLINVCEIVGLIEVERNDSKARISRIRINPDVWQMLISTR